MYLFLGQETIVDTGDIIGIFDLDNSSTSKITKNYLSAAQKNSEIVEVSPEIPKSFVVCTPTKTKKAKKIVYLSQISPSTLRKRTCFVRELASNATGKFE